MRGVQETTLFILINELLKTDVTIEFPTIENGGRMLQCTCYHVEFF